jgi:lipopolysaccharide/colanic/teichoic acid biosynthesis glycosyltransferase
MVKRALDLVGSALGLLALAPLFAFVAAWIKLDSPGPVFYASERWGQGGRRIRIWKFRTMVDGAHRLLETDPMLQAVYEREVKLPSDPRVTRVGQWLRRTSLDELPQLFNVLVGEMSLVGPRPKLFGEESRYGALLGNVLCVPPGMTGLWQVSGRSNRSYEERVALDVDYVRHCSLWFDLRLLIQTIPVVIRGDGAH